MSKSGLRMAGLSLKDTSMPLRPAFGMMGTPVPLFANYFEMKPSSTVVLYRYDVQNVTPEAKGRKLEQVVRLLLESAELSGRDIATDFRSTLLSLQKLDQDELPVKVTYRDEGEDDPRPGAKEFTINVQYTSTLDVSALMNYFSSQELGARFDDAPQLIQAFNIFLNHYAKSTNNLATVGSSKRFSLAQGAETENLWGGLRVIRGFFSSVRLGTGRLLVNVNVSHGAFFLHGPVVNLMDEFARTQPNIYRMEKFLQKLRIVPTHLPVRHNKKREVIQRPKTFVGFAGKGDGSQLDKDKRPKVARFGAGPEQVEFFLDANPDQPAKQPTQGGKKKGKKQGGQGGGPQAGPATASGGSYITVGEFFRTRYGLKTDPNRPVLNVGTRARPSYLPTEVCHVLPGQASNTKLSPHQTQEMIKFAVRRPHQNAESIFNGGFKTVGLSADTNSLLSTFGIHVNHQMIALNGRLLPAPDLLYSQKRLKVRDGGWNMAGQRFSNTAYPRFVWSWIAIRTPQAPGVRGWFDDEQQSKDIFSRFVAALGKVGIRSDPAMKPRVVALADENDPKLDETFKQAAGNVKLLLVILPDSTPLYKKIKTLGDTKFGLHTVCVIGSKFTNVKGQDQYFANIALKFNLKLGGVNQMVDSKRLDFIQENKTMIVGIDVTHPSPGSAASAPSIAGMVASKDHQLGQWPAILKSQRISRGEIVTDLEPMLRTRLNIWQKHHGGNLPENILVYRDGVSEGQYHKVSNPNTDPKLGEVGEYGLLRKACDSIYPATATKQNIPRITIVVCGKRHHTRFYPARSMDRSGNPTAGTVVDRGITDARQWDFFLQAHAAIQGTARPCHYVVVHDEIFTSRRWAGKNAADVLEDITQSLCYAFGRATKAVSLCTPAYYADLVCERARCYLTELFDESPTGSVISESTQGKVQQSDAARERDEKASFDQRVKLHQRMEDTMFYI
ncbi:putative RNA interference and silencing protein [Zalerion maritima]|uniref:RNA interference and silencing protein n=1 Tax=Zalerion maritima TaxID=339359 RepID=A0AAD5S560_9PEZI|nr:putative RNA interference and silencing protein [Zalerion maritima]